MPREGKSNASVVVGALALIGAMVMLVALSVPLYGAFCRVTGYGGTTQRAQAAGEVVPGQRVTVRFNADVDPGLPWAFKPMEKSVTVTVGQPRLIKYWARNLSDKPITGHAVFNVTPQKAGLYFSKIQCFCFNEQTLQPGEEISLPVTFFIDPEITRKANVKDVHTITLSYTFYRSDDPSDAVTSSSAAKGDTFASAGVQQ